MHFLKKFGIGSGIFFVLLVLSFTSAEDQLEPSSDIDLETLEEIQEDLSILSALLEPQNESVSENAGVSCRCSGMQCKCCQRIRIRKIGMKGDCCLSVSYLKSKLGVRIALTFRGRTLFKKEVSIKKPSPICVKVPYLKKGGSVCIELYNLKLGSNFVSGCIKFWAKVLKHTVAKLKLGCFRMKFLDEDNPVETLELPFFDDLNVDGDKIQMESIEPAFDNKLK